MVRQAGNLIEEGEGTVIRVCNSIIVDTIVLCANKFLDGIERISTIHDCSDFYQEQNR